MVVFFNRAVVLNLRVVSHGDTLDDADLPAEVALVPQADGFIDQRIGHQFRVGYDGIESLSRPELRCQDDVVVAKLA